MLTIVVILLAVTTSFRLITLAFTQNELTENRIIAINLAREGMEAVRYIRDYNWLYYGSNPRICWNHLEDFNNDGELDKDEDGNGTPNESTDVCRESGGNGFSEHQMGTGDIAPNLGKMEYTIKQKGTHWFLSRGGVNGHLIGNGDWNTLTKDNVAINLASGLEGTNSTDTVQSFRICNNADNTLLTSCLNVLAAQRDGKRTPFTRFVKIEYPGDPTNTSDTNANGIADGAEQNSMKITVGVKWVEKGILQDVEMVGFLTDFYHRTPLNTIN